MSEIVNSAVIKVAVDADGVETGLRKIDEASAKTARTVENLGKTSGFKPLGDGAAEAGGKIDRSTKNMADAIQRATAAMQSGTKGSVEYYAALANSRGVSLSTLKPYLDQLEQVTRKTAQAAEAQRQMEASNRFLDGLRAQADGIGKTAAQLAALRAEQLGVAEAARPLIEQLQAAEDAAGGAEESFSGFASALAAAGLTAGLASVAAISDQYGQFTAQLKLATEGQAEFANAQTNVRRIATSAQSDLTATASLYASITNGTRELGLAQSQVAKITESVSLALKVSGASGQAAAGAILQLGQAFASGTLRGDEFNSVNEASPRLMQALADGMGVPIGALRKLAEEGELTSAVLAEALPRALGALQNEARSIETVGGAVTVLKNNILEMVGATAQSSGVVSVLSGGINLLANNLTLAAGAMGTVVAVKLGASLATSAQAALSSVAANRALAVSSLASAQANVRATATAAALATARVAELRASVGAAEGAVALAIATNGLIPAQARATAAAAAHTSALAAQSAAMGAASLTGGALRGALSLLGGPIGAVIGVLGLAATAWAVWGESAQKAEGDATGAVRASTDEILTGLDKQIAKLRERNNLAKLGFKPSANESPATERLGEVVGQIDRAGRGQGEYANLNLEARTDILKVLGKQYGELTTRIEAFNRETAVDAENRSAKTAGEWMQKYANNSEKLTAELAKARKELGSAFTPELEARIKKQFEERKQGIASETSAYGSLKQAIEERVDAMKREAAGLAPLTDAQKLQSRLDTEIASGKAKLTSSQKAYLTTLIAEASVSEEVAASRKRAAQGAADWIKIQKEMADGAARSVADAVKEAEKNEELARTYGMTRGEIEAMTLARLEDQLAQRSAVGMTLDEIETLEKLIDAKKRSVAATGSVEAQELAKRANEAMANDWKRTVEKYEDVFRDGFADMLNNGADGWKSFTKSLATTFKTTVADQIYKMFAQPFVVKMVASLLGVTGGSAASSVAQAAGVPVADAGSLASVASSAQAAYKAISGGFSSMSTMVADGVQAGMSAAGYYPSAASGLASGSGQALTPFASGAGTVAGYAAGAAVGIYGGRAISNGYSAVGNSGNTAVNTGTAIGAVVGSIVPVLGTAIGAAIGGLIGGTVNRLFGRKAKEVTSTTLTGEFNSEGFSGSTDSAWIQKGGVFRSDKRGVDSVALEATVASQFSAGYSALTSSTADFAATLGINADAIKSRSQSMRIALTGDQAKDQEAIAAFFVSVGDTIATELVPTLSQFSKGAESASGTLQRIAGDYAFVDVALAAIGDTFGAVGLGSVAARERLLELTGGLEAFGKGTAFFAQNFLSEAERLAPVAKTVEAALASLGLASIDTRDEFKNVVLGLDLTSESGAKTYASLMGIQEQFAALYPAVEATTTALDAATKAAKEQRQTLQDQLDDLTMSPAQLVSKQRAKVDPTNVDLFDQIEGAKASNASAAAAKAASDALAAAAQTAAEALRATNKSYQDQIDTLLKSGMSAAQVRAMETAGLDASTVALYDRLAALKADSVASAEAKASQERLAATNKSYQDQIDALSKSQMSAAQLRAFETKGMDASTVALYDRVAALKKDIDLSKTAADATIAAAKSRADFTQAIGNGLLDTMRIATAAAKSLREFNESLTLGNLSALDPDQKYREAKKQFESAAPTDTAAATAFLEASKGREADGAYYQRDFAMVQAKIAAGAAQQDSLAASIPAFWKSYLDSQKAPVVAKPAMVASLMPASSGGSSVGAGQGTAALEKKLDELGAKLEKALSPIADSTARTAEVQAQLLAETP